MVEIGVIWGFLNGTFCSNITRTPYQELTTTASTLLYLQTLEEANRRIVNKTMTLPMYKNYDLEPGVVHSSSDGGFPSNVVKS